MVTQLKVCAALLVLSLCSCGNQKDPAQDLPGSDVSEFIVEATITDIQSAIETGRSTCRDIIEAHLARIDAYDKPSGLGAITHINQAALDRATEIDQALARGDTPGSLFCAPILVKDNFDTHDMPTTGGSIALMGQLPPDDAFMVRRIREEGAIIIAKTNMAEWAFTPRQTISSSYGQTANAYSLEHVPAGSSGGTASGVATSFGVAGLGSDTGNSIRGPSSHLALFGIRSTIGLTSRDGVIPLLFDRDIAGPMTRTVEDGARIFSVVSGTDVNDPYTVVGGRNEKLDYTTFLDEDGLQGARIGVLRALSESSEADPAISKLFEQAIEDLRIAGAEIVDPFEIRTLQQHIDSDNFCPRFRYDMSQYLKAHGEGVPINDVNEAVQNNLFGRTDPRVIGALSFFADYPDDIHPKNWQRSCPDYFDHPGRQEFKNAVVAAMDNAQVDAIIYPTWNNPPARIERANEDYAGDNSQIIAPDTGLPAITVPMGYTHGSLPAGLQLLGRPYAEGVLIKFAYAYEQATQHRRAPEMFPPLVEQ